MPVVEPKLVRLFRNGSSQAVRIPKEFALPGSEATISRDMKGRLILTPRKKQSLSEVLRELGPGDPEDSLPIVEDPFAKPVVF